MQMLYYGTLARPRSFAYILGHNGNKNCLNSTFKYANAILWYTC